MYFARREGWGSQKGILARLGPTDLDLRLGYRGPPLLGEACLWRSCRGYSFGRWSEGFGRLGGGTEVGRGLA